MRMQSEEQEFIITKFKRHGHPITRKSLEKAVSWLRQQPSHSLDILLKKLSQLALDNSNLDDNLQHAIEILSFKNKNLSSYEDLLEDTRKRCIFALSPYECDSQTWFKERPEPRFFEFIPEQKLKNSQNHFKRISDNNKDLGRQFMLGLIFENYFAFSNEGKQKLIMQNEVTQIQLNFPTNYQSQCLLVPGCTYIVKGKQQGKNLAFKVQKIQLPLSPPQEKQTLIKSKFKQMCQNISAGKQTTGYQPYDFVKYDCVYTPPLHLNKPTLIFGNITLNKKTIERLKRLIDAYPNGVASIILLLSADAHEQVDFTIWLKCKVYLVPHISADGPRLLPKLPLLKIHFPGAKVVTNPVRFNIEGRELVFANYPLIRTILSHTIATPDQPQFRQEDLITKVTDLVFSQGTISIGYDHYWPQTEYFNITNESIVVVTDGVTATAFQKRGKLGGFANTGNFDRDGDFICLMSRAKQVIQLCGQMLE